MPKWFDAGELIGEEGLRFIDMVARAAWRQWVIGAVVETKMD